MRVSDRCEQPGPAPLSELARDTVRTEEAWWINYVFGCENKWQDLLAEGGESSGVRQQANARFHNRRWKVQQIEAGKSHLIEMIKLCNPRIR
jgi:hypothetical protein